MDTSTESLYGIPAEHLVAYTGVHLTTARRWKRRRRVPRWLQRLVAVCHFGELGHIQRAWDGWVLREKCLMSPEGWQFTPGEIRSIPFMRAQVRTYQAQERTHLQADWIDERFVELDQADSA